MKFLWRGEAYEAADLADLTWMEMEQVEEATGLTSSEIEEDPKAGGRARVIAAMCWVSVHRQNEAVTFAEFFSSKLSELEGQGEGEEETVQLVPPVPQPPVIANDPLGDSAGSTSEDSGAST